MIGALIALISLDMTSRFVAGGIVATTLAISGATNATPIVVQTSTPHGFIRQAHGIISGVAGNTAANGAWIMTPVDTTHLSLSTFDLDGDPRLSVGSGNYLSGGTIQTAFPDGSILLGRRNVGMQMAFVSPRVVFVPIGSAAWNLDPYGAVIPTQPVKVGLNELTEERQVMLLQRQLATESLRFEVHVTGCANPPDPDFGDFDVTQSIYHTLYASLFDLVTSGGARVLRGDWVSQHDDIQTLDSRGQKWVGVIEFDLPVTDQPLGFVPTGTVGTITLNLSGGGSGDQTVIVVPSNS